jgi:hypothetical protein
LYNEFAREQLILIYNRKFFLDPSFLDYCKPGVGYPDMVKNCKSWYNQLQGIIESTGNIYNRKFFLDPSFLELVIYCPFGAGEVYFATRNGVNMQVKLLYKGEVLTSLSATTSLDTMLRIMKIHAEQLEANLEDIGFEFGATTEDSLPYVSVLFLVGDNTVIGSINTPEYALSREFGAVDTAYKDKEKVVKMLAAEVSKAAHIVGNILKQSEKTGETA